MKRRDLVNTLEELLGDSFDSSELVYLSDAELATLIHELQPAVETNNCITCRDYLGLAGVASHNPQVVLKYNRLLNELGAEGMLIQIERYFDSDDISNLIQHIEDNLGENGIDLPY